MVQINENEKKIITQELPGVHIVRTMKTRSKRHRYYMEEDARALRLLRSLRGECVPERRKNGRG